MDDLTLLPSAVILDLWRSGVPATTILDTWMFWTTHEPISYTYGQVLDMRPARLAIGQRTITTITDHLHNVLTTMPSWQPLVLARCYDQPMTDEERQHYDAILWSAVFYQRPPAGEYRSQCCRLQREEEFLHWIIPLISDDTTCTMATVADPMTHSGHVFAYFDQHTYKPYLHFLHAQKAHWLDGNVIHVPQNVHPTQKRDDAESGDQPHDYKRFLPV